MKLTLKKLLILVGLLIFLMIFVLYFGLWQTGRSRYQLRSEQVGIMYKYYPGFFDSVFGEILPQALGCTQDQELCIADSRNEFDQLFQDTPEQIVAEDFISDTRHIWGNDAYTPGVSQPMYFISLLESGQLAKLFFSGDLVIEPIDTREEKLVEDLLLGKRNSLYGPYFNSEFIKYDQFGKVEYSRRWFKPAYLKDLYSQMEVVVPYFGDNQIIGAVVYLHGE